MRNAHAGTRVGWFMYAVRILVRPGEKSSDFRGAGRRDCRGDVRFACSGGLFIGMGIFQTPR
ncbi:hypothetical protein PT2222_230010 [Paraburkholderia tropica]